MKSFHLLAGPPSPSLACEAPAGFEPLAPPSGFAEAFYGTSPLCPVFLSVSFCLALARACSMRCCSASLVGALCIWRYSHEVWIRCRRGTYRCWLHLRLAWIGSLPSGCRSDGLLLRLTNWCRWFHRGCRLVNGCRLHRSSWLVDSGWFLRLLGCWL